MPVYIWRCASCHERQEITSTKPAPEVRCACGKPMMRDWREEAATNTYHPTKGRE